MRNCPNFSVDHSVNLSTDHFQPIECVQLYDQFQIFDWIALKIGTEMGRFQIALHPYNQILVYYKDFAFQNRIFFFKKHISFMPV